MFGAGLTGFATGFSLILAIGAQNAFVLRSRNRSAAMSSASACSAPARDALLITAGVGTILVAT